MSGALVSGVPQVMQFCVGFLLGAGLAVYLFCLYLTRRKRE